jgi:hypothetical protein
VLVLDGYPRSDVLEAVHDTSDAAFVSALESMGIETDDEAWSNYDRTYASVGSMLGLETMFTLQDDIDHVLPRLRGVSGGDGEFLRAFRDAGYWVTFSPSSWTGSRCDSIVDDCVAIGVTRSSVYWLMRGTVFSPIIPALLQSPWTDVALRQIESIAEIHSDAMDPERPSIVFMHAALPHPPVVFDSTCREFDESENRTFGRLWANEDGWGSPERFGEQVQCVGALVADQFRQIREIDPGAVVLVVSDHGIRSLPPAAVEPSEVNNNDTWGRLANLTAFGGPPRCDAVLDQTSVVGTFREMVRCLLGADIVPKQLDGFLVPTEGGVWLGKTPIRVELDDLWAGWNDEAGA